MKLALQTCSLLVLAIYFAPAQAQAPVADLDYTPPISNPAYARNGGPVVRIDEAHHNYHTLDGRYAAFAELLRRDGFRLEASKSEFSVATLAGASIMVIANAEAAQSGKEFESAFTNSEIAAISQWVEQGGALLIIADHPPFSNSAAALAKAFGFEFEGGVALNAPTPAGQFDPIVVFEAGKGLTPSPLTSGHLAAEQVDSVMTFTGSAFRAPSAATSVLVFREGARSYAVGSNGPDFTGPSTPIAGLSQGAILQFGKGRVAVFGEAAMFTAQRGPNRGPMGMNTPGAERNYQFVLNLMHWLSRAKTRRAM